LYCFGNQCPENPDPRQDHFNCGNRKPRPETLNAEPGTIPKKTGSPMG